METEETRQDLVKIFTKVINNLSDEQFKKLTKYLMNADFSNDFIGTSKQKQIQLVTDGLDGLNREELISLSDTLVERLGGLVDEEIIKQALCTKMKYC